MLDKEQLVSMTWHKKVRQYYIDKGYVYTSDKDVFFVKAKDLQHSSKKKVDVFCDVCNKKEYINYHVYLKNTDDNEIYVCRNCILQWRKHLRDTKRSFELYELMLDFCDEKGYTLITKRQEMVKRMDRLQYMCNKHGVYTTTINSALQGKVCYECSRENAIENMIETKSLIYKKQHHERLLKICESKGYVLLSNIDDCINNKQYIQYECSKHGKKSIRIGNLLSGKGCPECAHEYVKEHLKFSIEKLIHRADECGGSILNIEDYINTSTKNLKCVCPECGEVFLSSLKAFSQRGGGQRCSECTKLESKGELIVKTILQQLDVDFEQQKWWSDCRDKNPMPFDFYLFKYNCVIEVMGTQHFYNSKAFGGGLEYIQKHDAMKFYYCWLNDINYLEIKYHQLDKAEQMILDKIKEIEDTHKDIV